jgi:hypothetical protein
MGMAGMRMQKTDEKTNWAKKLRMKSRFMIFSNFIFLPKPASGITTARPFFKELVTSSAEAIHKPTMVSFLL